MYDELKRQGQLKASRAEGKAEGKAEGVELAKTAINIVNGNQKCSDFGNSECSIFGIKTTVLLASAVQ